MKRKKERKKEKQKKSPTMRDGEEEMFENTLSGVSNVNV